MNPYANNNNNNGGHNSRPTSSSMSGPSRMQGDLESNFPQHTQAPLPNNYNPNTNPGYNNFGLPNTMGFSPSSNSPYLPPGYPRPNQQPNYPPLAPPPHHGSSRHQRGSSPPSYDRFGYGPPPPGQGVPPFINITSPNTRPRDAMNEGSDRQSMGGNLGSSSMALNRSGSGVEAEARMGQYIGYGQNPPPPPDSYQWPPVPPAGMSTVRAEPGSRRSTISRTTDDEALNLSGGDAEPQSRPSSPQARPKKTEAKQEKEDVDEDEEKIDHRKRKRNRTIRSCVPCHNHKRKCDRKRPCGRCTALGLTGTCVYEVDEVRDMSDPTVIETDRLRRRIAELEQVVRELRQRNPSRVSNAPPALTAPLQSPDVDSENKGQDNKKRRVIVDRFARFKIDEAAMAAVASAAAAGQDPVGGSTSGGDSRPNSSGREMGADDTGKGKKSYGAEPYMTYLLPGEEMVYDRIGRKTFLGAAAGKSMLRRLQELTSDKGQAHGGDHQDLLIVPEDAAFTGVFPDTRKTFPFTTIWSHENFSGEIIGLLPNREQSQVLFDSWQEEVCSFFLAWHVPTLEAEYKRFFAMSTQERMNVPLSSLSLFLMICSLGCVMRASRAEIFGHPDRIPPHDAKPYNKDSKDLTSSRLQSELYLSGAYQALRLCSFMSNPSVHTIQAQIMINIYLLNSERAADAWAQTGSLVRQCIAMGLHVDPVSLDHKISIRDAEVRRRMWWTVAGLDALFCLSFGRPSVINFYKTNLPQDREDHTLSDSLGTATSLLPPSNVLNNETTETTYHAAYFQLAIPSYELLDRMFHVDRKYSRSAIYGWFRPDPNSYMGQVQSEEEEGHTYEGALRLAQDIMIWYSHIPRGMRFEREEDTVERLQKTSSYRRINQTLALCVKTMMIIMVLHRPYLRADPSAYPESSEMCMKAALMMLDAYRVGSRAAASIFWSWWTMSFRAFHAGAVCAFLAIRQPGTERATQCIDAVKGAIDVLNDRSLTWNAAHPVQGDLCNGLVKLHSLACAATQQAAAPSNGQGHNRNRLSANWAPNEQGAPRHINIPPHPGFHRPELNIHPGTPLSQIRGFPDNVSPNPASMSSGVAGETTRQTSPLAVPGPFQLNEGLMTGDGFNGPESLALPQFWASMFGIKMEEPSQPMTG